MSHSAASGLWPPWNFPKRAVAGSRAAEGFSTSSNSFLTLLHPHEGVRKPSSGRVHSQGPFYSGQLVLPLNTSTTGGAEKIVAPQDLRGSQSCSRQEIPLLEPMQPARSTSGSHWKTRLVPAGLTPPVIVNASCVFIFPFIFLFRISTVPEFSFKGEGRNLTIRL